MHLKGSSVFQCVLTFIADLQPIKKEDVRKSAEIPSSMYDILECYQQIRIEHLQSALKLLPVLSF